jgi:peptidoglycan/xylan/chitin deacetylase (PgdA/CDA1 family)
VPRLLLTFDDGPGPSTPALLDVLGAAGVRATFFLLGANLELRREIAVRAAREGHELGNHTYSHARFDAIDVAALATELATTDELVRGVLAEVGRDETIRVRLPYGIVGDDPRLPMLAAVGREHVGWTADFADWLDPEPGELAARMRQHVDDQHARGLDAVLDLHDSSRAGAERSATVEAVRRLLSRA